MPRIDDEIRAVIPEPSAEEMTALEAAVKAEGCRDPLVVWAEEDILLDGHHRYTICESLGLEYRVERISFDSRAEAMAWVISNQLARRNLNAYQRARLALKRKDLLAALAVERMKAGWNQHEPSPDQNSGQASQPRIDKQLASDAGVSHDTIHKVGVIESHADEETKAALEAGKTTIHAAFKKVRPKSNGRRKMKKDKPKPAIPCGKCPCCRAWAKKLEAMQGEE